MSRLPAPGFRLPVGILLLLAGTLRADDTWLRSLAADARVKLDAAIAARVPKLVPPVPVEVKWKPVRLGALDLDAPVVALVAADLDRDRKAELYAVTAHSVVAIAVHGRVRELARVPFVGEPAVPQPRDVVGSAIAARGEVIASASPWAKSLRVSWKQKQLVGDPGEAGFELCPGEHAQLAPGRNYFGEPATAYYTARCGEAVDAQGYPLHVRAQLSATNKLEIVVQKCAPDGTGCADKTRVTYTGVGTAFDLGDIDRDGTPEVIVSGAVAPGDPDVVRVISIGDDEKKHKLKKTFTAGGIAAVAVGDFDGDGTLDVIAAVRLAGSPHVELWRLD